MSTLGTAYVQILPSADGISGQIQKVLDPEATLAGKSTGMKIASMAKKYIGAAAIGATIKKSVEEGAKLEQSLGGVETLYKKHADVVIENANRAYQTAGISANEYMEQSTKFAASLLQSLDGDSAKAAEYANRAIIDMSDNANKFGTNIEDIQNAYQGFAKQNYTMLDNLKLGYGGTKSEMERLISDASKMTDAQKALGVEVKEGDLSFSNIADAISVVQKEMEITGTTSDEAAGTLAGSFASMKAAASNFLGSIALGKNVGSSMKGLITSAKTFLIDNLIPALLNIAKSIPTMLFTGIKVGIPALLSGLASLVPQLINTAISIVDQLTNKLVDFVNGMAENPGMAEGGLQIVGAIAKAILLGAPKLAVALGKLALTIPVAVKAMLGNLIAQIVATLGTKLSQVVGKVKKIFNNVKNAILDPTKSAKEKLQAIIDKIKSIFNKLKLKLNIKIPSISVSGGKAPFGIAGKGSLPHFHVKWKREAEEVPYMFRKATIFGAGEGTQDEMLYGHGSLMNDISEAVDKGSRPVTITNYITVDGATDPEEWAMRFSRRLELEMRAG